MSGPILPDAAAGGWLPPSALKVIGVGPAFPFAFTGAGSVRAVAVARGVDKINQSIRLILTTRLGERVMNPEFGSRVPDCLFMPDDMALRDLLYIYAARALARWEPRISLTSVTFPVAPDDADNGLVRMRIIYSIKVTGSTASYVFPFVRNPMPMSRLVRGTPTGSGGASGGGPFLLGSA